jgi:endonuclease YncB( thermonuclease family)
VAGAAVAVDGDTLALAGVRVRLAALDAFERDQPLGPEARALLGRLTAGRETRCVVAGRDRWGRLVARCFAAGRDLGAALVAAGLALAWPRWGPDYIDHQARAMRARAGAWAGAFLTPWEWRARP